MAYQTNLSLNEFLDTIGIVDFTIDLSENRKMSRLIGGPIVTTEFGTRYWYGSVTVRKLARAKAEEIQSKIRVLQRAGQTFYIQPKHLNQSAFNTGTLNNVGSGGNQVSISGLPANTWIEAGTFFSFPFNNSARQAFHQIAERQQTNASGVMPLAEIVPPLIPGYNVGSTTVTLGKPTLIAQIVPGTFSVASMTAGLAGNFSFEWQQVV